MATSRYVSTQNKAWEILTQSKTQNFFTQDFSKMVTIEQITRDNRHFAAQRNEGLVCVFAGATQGIGYATLKKMVTMLQSSTFYVFGRSAAAFADKLKALQELSPDSKIIFIETQVSLISDIDNACRKITSMEKKVDYLCMSPGGLPYHGAVYTKEGLETSFAISYYSRMRLVLNLRPLLRRATQPRILSVLGGSRERAIDDDDVGLENHWSIFRLISHTIMLTSLSFDYLSANESSKKLTFIHSHPGLVYTGSSKPRISMKDGYLWWLIMSFLQRLGMLIVRYVGTSVEVAGERHAWLLTSEAFTPGSWRTSQVNDIVQDNDALIVYKERGCDERFWEHTLRAWDRALGMESAGNS